MFELESVLAERTWCESESLGLWQSHHAWQREFYCVGHGTEGFMFYSITYAADVSFGNTYEEFIGSKVDLRSFSVRWAHDLYWYLYALYHPNHNWNSWVCLWCIKLQNRLLTLFTWWNVYIQQVYQIQSNRPVLWLTWCCTYKSKQPIFLSGAISLLNVRINGAA